MATRPNAPRGVQRSPNVEYAVETVERRTLLAVTASFTPAMGLLFVSGDTANNTITISRTAAGGILVNGGAVAIAGGTTSLFTAFPATWRGQTGDSTSILLTQTLKGDTDLNRTVNFNDLLALAKNYNVTLPAAPQTNTLAANDRRQRVAGQVLS